MFRKYDMLFCMCTSCVALIDALSTWHHTQIMSLLDDFSKESQSDLVVLSRVPDLKFRVLTSASPENIHQHTTPTYIHTHHIDPSLLLHTPTHTHTRTYACTYIHSHTPTYTHTPTYQFLQETVSAFQWTHFPAVIHHITTQQYQS